MDNVAQKRGKRRFISRLKKILSNTMNYGGFYATKKNEKQVQKKKYIKNKNKFHLRNIKNKKEILYAPDYIDFYNVKNFPKTIYFLDKLKRMIRVGKKRVSINFDNTKKITASAMLSFLAEVDILINENEQRAGFITFTHPKSEKIESILKQIGFYELLGKKTRHTKEFDDVSYWNYASGVTSETQRAEFAMKEIEIKIGFSAKRKLYKGFSEAMANCVEHAYLNCEINEDQTKWWAFAGVKNDTLIVVICDKGMGIPKSLPLTRSEEVINNTLNLLSLNRRKDSAMIKVASKMGKTRTKAGNRGKGLSDVRSIIDKFKIGSLSIYSNKGYYRYYGHNDKIYDKLKDYPYSVCGTIVEWSIPLSIDNKEVVL
ncbi:ATP-binding protein [Yersinia proxima]|uniref:ATP-binding protein n=1 Tax=Yersinia proxima TaxID=2890316 RepID=UPI003D6858F4